MKTQFTPGDYKFGVILTYEKEPIFVTVLHILYIEDYNDCGSCYMVSGVCREDNQLFTFSLIEVEGERLYLYDDYGAACAKYEDLMNAKDK